VQEESPTEKKNRKTFKSKSVIITGASAGIGEQLAYKYATEGSRILLSGRRENRLQEVSKRCKELGAQDVAYIAGDLSKEAYSKSIIDEALSKFGGIDLVILNAGIGCLVPIKDMTFPPSEEIENVVKTNFWSCIWLTVLAVPHLRQSKGSIAFISSLSAVFATPRRAVYAATKCGINVFFKSLRIEEPQIDVTVICPGFVLTELHDRAVSPQGGAPKRQTKNFMSAEECAGYCTTAIAERQSLYLMTWIAWFGSFIAGLFPDLLDAIVVRYSESSVIKE